MKSQNKVLFDTIILIKIKLTQYILMNRTYE